MNISSCFLCCWSRGRSLQRRDFSAPSRGLLQRCNQHNGPPVFVNRLPLVVTVQVLLSLFLLSLPSGDLWLRCNPSPGTLMGVARLYFVTHLLLPLFLSFSLVPSLHFRAAPERSSNFTFCGTPFVLDSHSKAQILAIESQESQQSTAMVC